MTAERTWNPIADWKWLRYGLAIFLWASSRSLASLHPGAARSVRRRPPGGGGFDVAGSFVQYLFERQGMERLRRFYRRADKIGVDAAARAAFGRGFFELRAEWQEMLRSIET
jgi:hypothetical protein